MLRSQPNPAQPSPASPDHPHTSTLPIPSHLPPRRKGMRRVVSIDADGQKQVSRCVIKPRLEPLAIRFDDFYIFLSGYPKKRWCTPVVPDGRMWRQFCMWERVSEKVAPAICTPHVPEGQIWRRSRLWESAFEKKGTPGIHLPCQCSIRATCCEVRALPEGKTNCCE